MILYCMNIYNISKYRIIKQFFFDWRKISNQFKWNKKKNTIITLLEKGWDHKTKKSRLYYNTYNTIQTY